MRHPNQGSLAILLVPALVAVARSSADPARSIQVEQEVGTLGFQPPEVTDVRMRDALPHQDSAGGSNQSLIALTGARGGGFAAFWRDQRDGILGLYLARLSADGTALEPERPTYAPHTARRIDPDVAIAADGSGAVTWTSIFGQGSVVWMRCFDASGAFQGEERAAMPPVDDQPAAPPAGARGGRAGDKPEKGDVHCRRPCVIAARPGVFALGWTRGNEIQLAEYNARGEAITNPIVVNGTGPAADPGLFLAAGANAELGCLWTSAGAPQVSVRGPGAFVTRALGAGVPYGILADPTGGFWVLLAVDAQPVLRHLAADGQPDRAPIQVESGAVSELHFAVLEGAIALLMESAAGSATTQGKPARGGAPDRGRNREAGAKVDATGIRLALFDAQGAPKGDAFVVPSSQASEVQNARIASNGAKLLVAWTDTRNGNPDVYGRFVDPSAASDARLTPERRLNTDEASSDQIQSAIASNGEHGVVLWIDKRTIRARPYIRRVTRRGFEGDEIALPAPFGEVSGALEGGSQHLEAAVRQSGEMLVTWKQHGTAVRIMAQILTEDGRARGAAFELASESKDTLTPSYATALSGERGYLVTWAVTQGGGVWCRRVQPDGKLVGVAKRVSELGESTEESDVNIALLQDGRPLCAWTSHAQNYSCHVRFLDDSGEPRGQEIELEHWKRANDWDPALAPADNGGFLVTWTSGWLDDGVRDVCVRLYDAQGHAKGPIMSPCKLANEQDFPDVTRMADGSFAVVWEDDISYFDQTYVRRVLKSGKDMGPIMRLVELETKFVPDHVAPRIAALGDGFAAVLGDRRRSLGMDTRVKIVGPRFDEVPKDAPKKNR